MGINHHLGSLFLDGSVYLEGLHSLLEIAMHFNDLEFIDMGGGFGIPYKDDESRLNLSHFSHDLNVLLDSFLSVYNNKQVVFKIEPGRYIVAECGILLGTVYSTKTSYGTKFIGTDLGFNVLIRPVMYDSYHGIEIVKHSDSEKVSLETSTIVGNLCESGDIIAKDRTLPIIDENDIIAVKSAGAYGYSMSSNYNCRLRPAEVLIELDGSVKLIRKRETLEDLVHTFTL